MRLRKRHASLLEESGKCFSEATRLQGKGTLLEERAAAALQELNAVLKQKGKALLEPSKPSAAKPKEESPPQLQPSSRRRGGEPAAAAGLRSRQGHKAQGKGKGTSSVMRPVAKARGIVGQQKAAAPASSSRTGRMPLLLATERTDRSTAMPQRGPAAAGRAFLERPCRFVETCAFAPPRD